VTSSTHTRILDAASELLAGSVDGEVSTRAICAAAGVGAPALYRAFGDKDGLLRAVVERAFGAYLAAKRSTPPSDDPVSDLEAGWDGHIDFALANPRIYRLMYSPVLPAPEAAVAESFALLRQVLQRCAARGLLRMSAETATQLVMAANVGLALNLIARPAQYPDPAVADRMRDAVIDSILVPREPTATPARMSDTVAPEASEAHGWSPYSRTASTLAAELGAGRPAELSAGETTLLQEWLRRLADGGGRSSLAGS
jgi:AcrR family transcriptional regulator